MSAERKSPEELRRAFLDAAIESQKRVAAGEPVYDANDVIEYLRAKAEGRKVEQPRPIVLGVDGQAK